MPMSAPKLSQKLLKSMRAFIKAMAPDATPQEFQKIMADAIAKGVVKSIKQTKATASSPAGSQISPSVGIQGLDPVSMTGIAQGVFLSKNGTIGVAMVPIFTAIFSELALHMKTAVKVESTSGYGGQLDKFTVINKTKVLNNILMELPPQVKTQLFASKSGKLMFEAIATGFVTDLLTKGKPTLIPASGGDDTGLAIGKFS